MGGLLLLPVPGQAENAAEQAAVDGIVHADFDIVLHTQVKILFLFPCPYFDLTVTIHKLHAMINGVFHHRLQDQL